MRLIKVYPEKYDPPSPREEDWEPDPVIVTCIVCGAIFEVMDDSEEFECPDCGKPYTAEYDYRQEKFRITNQEDSHILCVFCGEWKKDHAGCTMTNPSIGICEDCAHDPLRSDWDWNKFNNEWWRTTAQGYLINPLLNETKKRVIKKTLEIK